MTNRLSRTAREELIDALAHRYHEGTKKEKSCVLDEFVKVAGCHRKHAIRLLRRDQLTQVARDRSALVSNRIYGEAVQQALVVVWEASDRICAKRLKAAIPTFVDAMERHGHLQLDPVVRAGLLSVSAATIDRLLKPKREHSKGKKRRRKLPTKPASKVPVKTFTEWAENRPGELEVDMVAHCGGNMSGPFIHSLVATDVCSGWVEAIPLLAREQSVIVEGLKVLGERFPMPILGINTDNDSAFINDTLISYCLNNEITFTRSRAYKKNDQAWIEQKNGSVVRRLMGYDRYSGIVAGQAMAQLYAVSRLYVNFFQPSVKLREKTRLGARVKKTYDPPTTPFDKLMAHRDLPEDVKTRLVDVFQQLDPIDLLNQIRQTQSAFASLSNTVEGVAPPQETVEQFLSGLAELWRQGEARPTHSPKASPPRHWRTRLDPFEGVWSEILTWLQKEPEIDARGVLNRLQSEYPGAYPDSQLRTLQRRLKDWRRVLARNFVFHEQSGSHEIRCVGPIQTEVT